MSQFFTCTVCETSIEAHDADQARETHELTVDDTHPLTLGIELTVEQIEWLHNLVYGVDTVATNEPDTTNAPAVLAKLLEAYGVQRKLG